MFFFKWGKKKVSQVRDAVLENERNETVCLDARDRVVFSGNEHAKFTIKLTDLKTDGRTWTLPVVSEILLGRASHCDIFFSDPSVSREQCKIVTQGDQLVVVQVGHTNNSRLNGVVVQGSALLHAGDVLSFGREMVKIEEIQALEGISANLSELLFRDDIDEDKTMSFF